MADTQRAFERLIRLAATQHGFVRTADLEDVGISQTYLRKQVAANRVVQRAQGLYRVLALPVGINDELYEALLWADGDAVGGESAISLWELADVNPRRITVVVRPDHRVRRRGGENVRTIYQALRPRDIDEVDGIPVVRPAVAIEQAIKAGVESSLIEQALTNARSRNLLAPIAEAHLRIALERRHESKRLTGAKA